MRLACLAVSLVCVSLTHAQTNEQATHGGVTGTVLDNEGQPVKKADVCTLVTSPSKISTDCRVQTDKTGQFHMQQLPMGTLRIFARKMESGYPPFNEAERAETVTLTAENPLAHIILKLGPKEGILIPMVRDKINGQPIRDFHVRWDINGGHWTATVGFSDLTRRTSLPVDKDILIEVSARGYKNWFYANPGDGRRATLRFESGEEKTLDVELEPERSLTP